MFYEQYNYKHNGDKEVLEKQALNEFFEKYNIEGMVHKVWFDGDKLYIEIKG